MKFNGFFAKLTTFHNYVYLATVYSCGLLLNKGLSLKVSDIDIDRMMIHVHRGKGAKDRYVPLPYETSNIETKIELSYGFDIETPEKEMITKASLSCPHCGGKLIYRYSVLPYQIPPEKTAPG